MPLVVSLSPDAPSYLSSRLLPPQQRQLRALLRHPNWSAAPSRSDGSNCFRQMAASGSSIEQSEKNSDAGWSSEAEPPVRAAPAARVVQSDAAPFVAVEKVSDVAATLVRPDAVAPVAIPGEAVGWPDVAAPAAMSGAGAATARFDAAAQAGTAESRAAAMNPTTCCFSTGPLSAIHQLAGLTHPNAVQAPSLDCTTYFAPPKSEDRRKSAGNTQQPAQPRRAGYSRNTLGH